jgi:hypothetical protein
VNLTIKYNWQPAMRMVSVQHISLLFLTIFGQRAILKFVDLRAMWLMRKKILPLAKVNTI